MVNEKTLSYNKNHFKLWYNQPASCWKEAMPLGNGRMGAMIYGKTQKETVDLSEITCFSGEKGHTAYNGKPSEHFHMARQAYLSDDYEKGEKHIGQFIGKRTNYGTNLPLGHLNIELNHTHSSVQNYKRKLCLDSALSCVEYQINEVKYSRTAFISNPHQVMVMKLTAGSPSINLSLSLDGGGNPHNFKVEENGDLILTGDAYETVHSDGKSGISFEARLRAVQQDGTFTIDESGLHIQHSTEVIILLCVETNYDGQEPGQKCIRRLDIASSLSYDTLLQAHVNEYQHLINRAVLFLGEPENIPTDVLIERVQNGEISPFLSALMFQYGRYLIISSSRPNSPLPAPLQGVWNDSVACNIGWTCDMHLDINTQMNYWPCEVTNLSECHKPLFHWIENELVQSGRETAAVFYNLDGWVAEVVSNAWAFTDPYWHVNLSPCPTGGAWVATHMWEHYQYTQSLDFLRENAFPVISESVQFFVDYLFEDSHTGYMASGPSISPENRFIYKGKPYSASISPTYEIVVIRELFKIFLESCEVLQVSDELVQRVRAALDALPPFQIGNDGELKEWSHDYEASDPQHRHISHLLALYPFNQITPEETPKLAEAAKITIEKRLTPQENWEDTGWARSMLMLYAARLKNPIDAFAHITAMQKDLTNTNLMVKHPPTRGAPAFADVYELDGNTGLTTCIAEMLLQSHRNEIELLPVLPSEWETGFAKGLCARGGFIVNLTWENGTLVLADVFSKTDARCRIRYKDNVADFDAMAGQTYRFDHKLLLIIGE